MGTDFQRPELSELIPGEYNNAGKKQSEISAPDDHWWQVFGDPEIDKLVMAVFANNPDIKKAAAQVLEVGSIFRQTRAERFPSIAAQTQYQKVHQPALDFSTMQTVSQTSDVYSLSIPVSFELDLWGRISRTT